MEENHIKNGWLKRGKGGGPWPKKEKNQKGGEANWIFTYVGLRQVKYRNGLKNQDFQTIYNSTYYIGCLQKYANDG